jgi:periplasmic protein CpxP/Spy
MLKEAFMNTHLALGLSIALGTTLLAVSTAGADGGYRCGQGHAMAHHGHGQTGVAGHSLRRLLSHQQEIGLSDEQIAKLRSVALDADRAAIRASADRQVSERELRAMLWDTKADMPAIEAKVKEAESFEAAIRIIGIRAKRDLLAVLTPEQQTKLKTLRHGYRHHDQPERPQQSDLREPESATSAG